MHVSAVCMLALFVGTGASAMLAQSTGASADTEQLGRQVLTTGDGWAADGGGTTGGSATTRDQISVSRSRAEFIAALGGDNAANGRNSTSKIIYLDGDIDGNVDDANRPLTCADYVAPEYSLESYLLAYDPAVWGKAPLSGPLEEARVRSAQRQSERVRINVGSNTTIFGLGSASMRGVNLQLVNVENVIIRNVEYQDAFDCFPSWDPTDGALGAWNTLYDNISLVGASHV